LLSPPQDQYMLWGTSPLIFIEYGGLSSVGKLTTYLHLVRKSRMSGLATPLPHTPTWHVQRQSCLINPISIHCVPKWRHMFRISGLRLYFLYFFICSMFFTYLYIPPTLRSLIALSYVYFVKYYILQVLLTDFFSFFVM
jgi:hypothetical protein